MNTRKVTVIAALVCLGASLTHSVTINLTTAVLQDQNGSPLPDNSTLMLIADTAGDGFGNLTSLAGASGAAFLNDADDVIVARFPLDSSTTGVAGGHIEPIQFDLENQDIGAGDMLILAWYLGLDETQVPASPGSGRHFGSYRTDSILNSSSSGWVVPDNNAATIELNMLTLSAGGSLANAEGLADQITSSGSCTNNQPPEASCHDVTVPAGGNGMATVTAAQVDNGSGDPDGNIVGRVLSPPGPFGSGDTTVTLIVTDDCGATNSCTATVTVQGQTSCADLTGAFVSVVPKCKTKGTITTCSLKGSTLVQNGGNVDAPAGGVLRYYLSSDQVLDAGDTPLVRDVTLKAVKTTKAGKAKLKATLPPGTSTTGKFVLAVFDPSNTIDECNESNNVVASAALP